MRRFVLRTIRDGAVRIGGRIYRPDECFLPYDGRLDGMRYAFGLYRGREDLVGLWGTEAAYRSDDLEADWPGPECVDGFFNWAFWHAV